MAIFGAGSVWDGNDEQSTNFFNNNNFVIGWDYDNARDLFDSVATLKAGDIIYLKSNQPGSNFLRIKGIGVVKNSLIHTFIGNMQNASDVTDFGEFSVEVIWKVQEEFQIDITDQGSKLTNVRAATFYEEHLPYIQHRIIEELLK